MHHLIFNKKTHRGPAERFDSCCFDIIIEILFHWMKMNIPFHQEGDWSSSKKSLKRTSSMNKEKDFNNQQTQNYDIEFERCIDFLARMFEKYSKDIILPDEKSENGLDS